MNKILNINIPTDDLSVALSNDTAYTITVTPTIPVRFDGWAYSTDGSLYKTFTSSAAQDILFSSEGTKTLYFRALRVVDGEEILDSEVIAGSQYVALPAVESIETSSFSGWNYGTSFRSPGSNAGGSNNKTFWNNAAYHGRGYYHPSSTNKQNMFDGNPNTYAGDYLIKTYSTAVWEKIAIDSNIDSGTANVKFSIRSTNSNWSSRQSPGFFLCWRRSDQAFNGTRVDHYIAYGYNSNTHTYQRRASRNAAIWDGGVTEKVYNYNISFTEGIEEILVGVFQGKSSGCCWGMRIYEVSVSS